MRNRTTATQTGRSLALGLLIGAGLTVSGCQNGGPVTEMQDVAAAEISTEVKFDSATYGVPASPRVTTSRNIRKGGGRSQIGKAYKVRGKWYYPKDEPGYVATGMASWYGPNFHGRLTANGETYDMHGLSAAHKTFPLPSYAIVTNMTNGNRLMVRVNDRGPFAHGREIDLSSGAAELLDFKQSGVAKVKVEYVGRAPIEGDDTQKLMASFTPGGVQATTMVASLDDRGTGRTAMALSGEGAEPPMPGVRPLATMFQNKPAQASRVSAMLSSFSEDAADTGATEALAALAGEAQSFKRINLGTIDRDLMARVGDVVGASTTARAEATGDPDFVSATVTVEPQVDPDRLLRKLWSAGFEDAFAVRD